MAINKQFTQEEWQALTDAEATIYGGVEGIFAYTDVMPRDDEHPTVAAMWELAQDSVDQELGYGPDALDENEIREETARRVALANALLTFGPAFIAEHVKDDNAATCKCGMWPVAEYGPTCPSCPS